MAAGIITWRVAAADDRAATGDGGAAFGAAIGTAVTLRHDGPIDSAGLSPNGKWVVTLEPANPAAARVAQIWDATTGQAPSAAFRTDSPPVFSPDGTIVADSYFAGQRATATFQGTTTGLEFEGETVVELRETATGRTLATLPGHQGGALTVFSPDGKTVATASTLATDETFDSPIRLWQATTGKLLATLSGHTNGVQDMTFSRDGKTLASSAAGGVTKIWDVPEGTATTTLTNVWFPVWISADGSTLAARQDKGFELRRLPSGKVLAKVSDGGSFEGFSPQPGTYAASAGGVLRLFHVDTQRASATLESGHVEEPIVFSPDGRAIVGLAPLGLGEKTPLVWDTATGRLLGGFTAHTDRVTDMVFTDGGRTLVTTGKDKTVRRWNVRRSWSPALRGTSSTRFLPAPRPGRRIAGPRELIDGCRVR